MEINQTDAYVEMEIMNQWSQQATKNNKLLEQADTLTKALAQGTVDKGEQSRLTSSQLRSLKNQDMQSIGQQLGMVKWTMSERSQSLQNAKKDLLQGMASIREERRYKLESARKSINEAVSMFGSLAFEDMSPADRRKLELEGGYTPGYLDRAVSAARKQEQAVEEERRLKLDSQRQQMELAERGMKINEAQLQLARAEASRPRGGDGGGSSQGSVNLSEWQARAIATESIRPIIANSHSVQTLNAYAKIAKTTNISEDRQHDRIMKGFNNLYRVITQNPEVGGRFSVLSREEMLEEFKSAIGAVERGDAQKERFLTFSK